MIAGHNQRIVYQMQKTKYSTCFYYSILFACSKRYQIKCNTLFHHEDQQQNRIKKILQLIILKTLITKILRKIYRECTKEPYNFLTIDTTLPACDPLRFRKNVFDSYKNDNN